MCEWNNLTMEQKINIAYVNIRSINRTRGLHPDIFRKLIFLLKLYLSSVFILHNKSKCRVVSHAFITHVTFTRFKLFKL